MGPYFGESIISMKVSVTVEKKNLNATMLMEQEINLNLAIMIFTEFICAIFYDS